MQYKMKLAQNKIHKIDMEQNKLQGSCHRNRKVDEPQKSESFLIIIPIFLAACGTCSRYY